MDDKGTTGLYHLWVFDEDRTELRDYQIGAALDAEDAVLAWVLAKDYAVILEADFWPGWDHSDGSYPAGGAAMVKQVYSDSEYDILTVEVEAGELF